MRLLCARPVCLMPDRQRPPTAFSLVTAPRPSVSLCHVTLSFSALHSPFPVSFLVPWVAVFFLSLSMRAGTLPILGKARHRVDVP